MLSIKSNHKAKEKNEGLGLLETRGGSSKIFSEGKNPVEVAKYYFKNEPDQFAKLTAKDNDLLKRIAALDVEYSPEKFEVGKLFPWLVSLYKKGDTDLMSLLNSSPNSAEVTKFKNAQQLFAKPQFRKSTGISDVSRFPSLNDFIQKVGASFIEKTEMPTANRFSAEEINSDIREGSIAKTNVSNDRFLVITPTKKKGACKYGNVHMDENSGRWCTAKEKDNAFDSYKDGILYIFMDRKDGYLSKYQLHYKDGNIQFKNEFNRDFDYESFFDENTDIFDRLFPKVAEFVNSGKLDKDSNLMKLFKMLPKKYKDKFREKTAKVATGILKSFIDCMQQIPGAEDQLDRYDAIGFDYDSLDFFPDGMRIHVDLDQISDGLQSWYYNYKQGYEGYEFQREEYDYMHNFVPDKIKTDFIDLLRLFKSDFSDQDFEEEAGISNVIFEKPAYKYFERLLDGFAIEYERAQNQAQSDYIDSAVKGLPFDLERDSIFIRYEQIVNFCLDNGIVSPKNIKEIIEFALDREGINDDNLYNHYENNPDYERLEKRMIEDFEMAKEKIEEEIENFEEIKKNSEEFKKYVKDLGFTKDTGNKYRKRTQFAFIEISDPNFEKGTVHMSYKDLTNNKVTHRGDVKIENLPKYATMPMALESLRRFVKSVLRS
jgi:hypothetical protein